MNVRRLRRFNRIYAETFGYFWLPCPLCGQMFGGHETGTASVRVGGSGWVPPTLKCCCWRHDEREHAFHST